MAARASPGGGRRVVRQDIAALRPMKWINDSIVNFVGEVMMQPWGGRGTAKVQVFSLRGSGTVVRQGVRRRGQSR